MTMMLLWGLAASLAAVFLVSHAFDSDSSADTDTATSATMGNDHTSEYSTTESTSGVTTVTRPASDNDSKALKLTTSLDQVVSSSRPPLPIHETGVISSAEYSYIQEQQATVALCLEPVALILMLLSAVAFLKDRKNASNIYLASICLFESVYIVFVFVHALCRLDRDCIDSYTYTVASIWGVSYIGLTARRCVTVVTMIVSAHRFVAVAFPFENRKVQFLQKPILPITITAVLAILLHVYRPLQYKATFIKDVNGGSWTQGFSTLYKANEDVFLGIAEVSKYVYVYLPMLACLISNCLLVIVLLKRRKELRNAVHTVTWGSGGQRLNAAKNQAERQITVLVLGSTFLSILLNTPININEAVSQHSDHYGMLKKDHYLFLVMRTGLSQLSLLCDVLVVVSYLLLGSKFRIRFISLFGFLCRLFIYNRTRTRSSSLAANSGLDHGNSFTNTTQVFAIELQNAAAESKSG